MNGMSMACLWMHVCCPKVFQHVVQLRSVIDENSLSATWQQPQNSSVVETWLPQQNPIHPNYTQYLVYYQCITSVLPVYYQCMTYSFPYFPNDFISLAFHIPSRRIGIRLFCSSSHDEVEEAHLTRDAAIGDTLW